MAVRHRHLRSGGGDGAIGAALPHRPAARAPAAVGRGVAGGHAAGHRPAAHAARAVQHGSRLADLAAGAGRGRGVASTRARTILGAARPGRVGRRRTADVRLPQRLGDVPARLGPPSGSEPGAISAGSAGSSPPPRCPSLVALGSLALLRTMFPPEPVAQLPMQRVQLQVAVLGPVAPREHGDDRHSRPDGGGLGGRPLARPRAVDDRAARPAGHRGPRYLRSAGAAVARLEFSGLLRRCPDRGTTQRGGGARPRGGGQLSIGCSAARSRARCSSCWRWPASAC